MLDFNFCIFLLLTFRASFCQNLVAEDASFLSQLFNVSINNIGAVANDFQFINISRDDVKFLLYDRRSNDSITLDPENPQNEFIPTDPTKIIIHGWTDSGKEDWIKEMAYFYHQKGNYNVIAIDWSKDADDNYVYSSSATQGVGFIVGDFIVDQSRKADILKNFHIIGHSLGAQVSGFAGKRVKTASGKKLDRITGLDAASPLFETPVARPPELHLTSTDADFVDGIHTALGIGYIQPFAVVDFYVNGGIKQLNCTDSLDLQNTSTVLYFKGTWLVQIFFFFSFL